MQFTLSPCHLVSFPFPLGQRHVIEKILIDDGTVAGDGGHAERAVGVERKGVFDDVALEVAVIGADVTGQGEVGQAGQCDIASASDAGFQHAAMPDWNAWLPAPYRES